ncbi:MAG: hypothetical protein ACJ786_01605 [Catenulispora sp.]
MSYGLGVIGSGARLARGISGAAADAAGRTALHGLDAALRWRYTDEAVKRVLASPAADNAVTQVTEVVVEGETLERLLDRLLAEGVADRLADRLLDGPEIERIAAHAIDSRLLDTIVDRLLESQELWVLVDEVARSPAVTEAIGQQGVGFADQVAGQVRQRSQRADARLEEVARRLLRRRAARGAGVAEPRAP